MTLSQILKHVGSRERRMIMVKILTKAKAIEEHRKMWEWMKECIAQNMEHSEPLNVVGIWDLKKKYFQTHPEVCSIYSNGNAHPYNRCFLCEYNEQIERDRMIKGCKHCPADLSKIPGDERECLNGLYHQAMSTLDQYLFVKTIDNAIHVIAAFNAIINVPERDDMWYDITESDS